MFASTPWVERYQTWLRCPVLDQETKAELEQIRVDYDEIKERFWKDLEFGTGGLRGIMGAGTNRINKYVVRRATQGLVNYMAGDPGVKEKSAVIAYDSRHNSREFAEETARVLVANGFKTYLFEDIRPTPELSFAILKLKAAAGVVITASHNPSQYNGYKIYWSDGAQITPDLAKKITEAINRVDLFTGVTTLSLEAAQNQGLLHIIGEDIDSAYLKAVQSLSLYQGDKKKDLKIVYTPFHGTGNIPVRRMFRSLGYEKVYPVDQQLQPDGAFPTVKYPNPEESEAFALAIALGYEVGADIILGTDPDCDRVGCLVKDDAGLYTLLIGNQTGALLLDYILRQRKAQGNLPPNGTVVKTIVTSELGRVIAEAYGLETIDTLTGFKYIGEKMKEFETEGSRKFIFGCEESYGFLTGTFVRDKDGVIAAMLIAEMAAFYREKGLTLYQVLQQLYQKYGYYREDLSSIRLEGSDGMRKMAQLMTLFRTQTPEILAGWKVIEKRDYQTGQGVNILKQKTFSLKLPQADVLYFKLEDDSWFCVRPSGTEPKMKFYFSVKGKTQQEVDLKFEALQKSVLKITRKPVDG